MKQRQYENMIKSLERTMNDCAPDSQIAEACREKIATLRDLIESEERMVNTNYKRI